MVATGRCNFLGHGQRKSSETRTLKMKGTLLTVLSAGAFLQCLYSAILPPNPCPNLFQYLQDKNGDVYGRVMLENDYSGYYIFLVNMSIAVYPLSEQKIIAELVTTAKDIVAGRPLVYNIFFPIQDVIPRLTSIKFNNNIYCSGPSEELGPNGVTEMWAVWYYRIHLPFRRPPADLEKKWQADISSLTQQPPIQHSTIYPWKPWQQPLFASSTYAPFPRESWQGSSTDRTTLQSLCSSPNTTPARLPSWLLPRGSTCPTTSASLSSSSWHPSLTASTKDATLPTQTGPPFSTFPTTSASLSSSPWQSFLTASATDTPFPKRTSRPFLMAPTTSAPLSSKLSTHSTKPLQGFDWLSQRPTIAATAPTPSTKDFSLSGEECGLSMVNTHDPVVDGDDFVDGQFPWLVAILYINGFDYKYKCTGSLVSNRHVITAGHCVRRNKEVENYLLVFGKKNVHSWLLDGAIQRELQNISVHPDYNYNKKDADIAIITVKEQIEFEAHIKPVCLWQGEEYMNRMAGMQGTVAGWWSEGRRDFDARKIDLSIVSQTECLQSSPSISSVVSNRTFCAGLKGPRPCHGDNGAGFVMQNNGRWILRGVVFTAVGDLDRCDDHVDNYFVSVDIDKVMSWLKQVIMP